MSDADAVIGRLYRALTDAEEQKNALIAVIKGIKAGTLPLDRIEVTETGVTLLPEAPGED